MIKFEPWISDLGNGDYKNPVLFADYSDPDVIRVNEIFYMTASSFNCTPGLPILKSVDLVNWELIGHGVKNLPDKKYDECLPGCGIWAPAIRYYNNTFYIVFPMPDEGIYVIESKDPRGDWSSPILLIEGKGLIDPCPFWDEDGKTYIIHGYAFSRCGIKSKLNLIEVSSDLKKVFNSSKIIIDAMNRLPTLEGPKMFKKDNFYYISAPAGGVPQGWQMIFRSHSPWGPYTEKIVLEQRGTVFNGPHQGAIIDDIKGNFWFIHFQDYQPWGRIVHLQPAYWENGWPIIGINQNEDGIGMPVERFRKPSGEFSGIKAPDASDSFLTPFLGLQWQWNANHDDNWYLIENNSLVLYPGFFNSQDFHLYPRILGQKLNAPEFSASVKISFIPLNNSDESGITICGIESARLCIKKINSKISVAFYINSNLVCSEPVSTTEAVLFTEIDSGGMARFGYIKFNSKYYMGQRFRVKEGRWIGARFGIYCGSSDSEGALSRIYNVSIN